MKFTDRTEAGRQLAKAIGDRLPAGVGLVLGLSPGGVAVAAEVARHLKAPLDVFVMRKLPVPGHPELAMGAVASGGVRVVDEDRVAAFALTDATLEDVAQRETRELEKKERLYRGDRPALNLSGRTVVLVDDALETGATIRFAIQALRRLGVAYLMVAVPVGPGETCEEVCTLVDDLVCMVVTEPFHASEVVYGAFAGVDDAEVQRLLAEPAPGAPEQGSGGWPCAPDTQCGNDTMEPAPRSV